ncbi:hypothetical protein PoB_001375500 [Plakobranchus ocellatus]|uniref:Uncharacterized protein n=1 Tax=Plakobranchus ocellatus TaxID=259542 RepID=A0AAV3YXQ7_9GAST|nr:hypothetical protein PoB_001375500 [Plakobranchus ocellatus]
MKIHRIKMKCLDNSKDQHLRQIRHRKTKTSYMIELPRPGNSTAQKEEQEAHLRMTYFDPEREKPLEDIEGLVWPSTPGV